MAKLLSGTRIYGTATVDTQILLNGTVPASSTITGALQVVGGVGIGGNLYVGGTIYQNGVAISTSSGGGGTVSTGSATVVVFNNTFSSTLQYLAFVGTSTGTANALQVSAPNGLVYQPSTGYVGIGLTSSNILSALHIASVSAVESPVITLDSEANPGRVTGINMLVNFTGLGLSTSSLVFDFYGSQFNGGTGVIGPGPVVGPGSWGMNYVSGRPYFGNHWFRDYANNVQMSIVDNVSTRAQLSLGYAYQTYNFAPSYSALIQGSVGIGTTATTATLTVLGNAFIIGATTQTGIQSILNRTGATSTTSGALVVTGGAGIGGALYVGGAIYSSGTQITAVSPPINLTASQGQTTFVVPGGYNTVTMVFANGVLLNQSDYTASTSPNVILNIARNAGDTITIVFGQSVATPISQVASAAAMAMVLGI